MGILQERLSRYRVPQMYMERGVYPYFREIDSAHRIGDQYRRRCFLWLYRADFDCDSRIGDQYRLWSFLGLHGADFDYDSRVGDQYWRNCFLGLYRVDRGNMECPGM